MASRLAMMTRSQQSMEWGWMRSYLPLVIIFRCKLCHFWHIEGGHKAVLITVFEVSITCTAGPLKDPMWAVA